MTRNHDADDGQQPDLSEADLESLLIRGRLPDPRRERIIRNVLASVAAAPPRASRRPTWWGWTGLVLAATAVPVVVLVAARSRTTEPPAWQARGAPSSTGVEIGCSGGSLTGCPSGSTLIFRAHLAGATGYLSAYAEPLSPGGQRVWYFADKDAPLLVPSEAPVVVGRGIRIGSEHPPGTYQVHLLITRRPLVRTEVLAVRPVDLLAAQDARLVVLP